ncbi:MAG: hypothetical protein JSV86_02150 [Gemmatimonadota bacterium]|nr:MAG: hypothetical protein JSV86_02150 [Gemmatimonadota bacterium]
MANAAVFLVTALVSLAAGPTPEPYAVQDTATARQAPDQGAVYRREKFVYPSDNRRNPFVSLIGPDVDTGPIFDDLDLMGIIFGGSVGSVATVIDRATDKRYRVRRGDVVGNARVVEIRPDAVVFQVTEFGVTRSETLRIRRGEEEEEQG